MLDQSFYQKADEIIAFYGKKPASLIPIMQDIQGEYRNLPEELLYKKLGLSKTKKTTDDMMFTVETVSCLGACGLAPTMMVNEEVYPRMTPEKADELIDKLRGGEQG